MSVESLIQGFQGFGESDAIVWKGRVFSYFWLAEAVDRWRGILRAQSVAPGTVVSLEADFSPNSVALLVALIENLCIIVPMTSSVEPLKPEFREVAEVELIVQVGDDDEAHFRPTSTTATRKLLASLKQAGHPGLVLFSSGSTGKNKGSVHDFMPLLKKFEIRRHAWRTITFLLFDHVGGVNTLFYTLSNGGCVVTVQDRSPDAVCEAIESFKVQLLPTSPTFLNLLLISEAHRHHDLSSLEVVTYGTEVMPESTLKRLRELFPALRMQQTYGLSEVGILRSKSRSSDSLWVKIGGEGFQTRVVDGMLEIKAESTMLGYLNAPSPFTEDGWFKTGDSVDVDGEFFRFLGRNEEIIVVGGEKVYPAEVESVLQQLDGVEEVVVSGEASAITGQIVRAVIKLSTDEDVRGFRQRMNSFCRDRLPPFKIPQKVVLAEKNLHGDRFKKIRRSF